MRRAVWVSSRLIVILLAAPLAMAQQPAPTQPAPAGKDYIIGAEDILDIQVWGSNDLNQTVFVRPDGRLSLPLVGEIAVAGKTVQQLQDHLLAVYEKAVKGAVVTVIVKEIKSRRVFITGRIEKPGPYPLNGRTTILQLIAMAGGLREFVDGKNISLMRSEKDKQTVFDFNYQDVVKKRYLHQNIELKPGDVVVVP